MASNLGALTIHPANLVYTFIVYLMISFYVGLCARIKYNGAHKIGTMSSNVLYHDITANNYTIPAEFSAQHYFFSSFPNLPVLHHIIRIDPLIQSRNENVEIHHIVITKCFLSYCMGIKKILFEWSPGRGIFYFPSHIGLELGGTDHDKLHYVAVNIHYTNWDKLNGITDNSGLRFYYTPTLRKHSAMIMSVGVGYLPLKSIMIPGNMDDVIINGYCPSQCTLNSFPKNGINIVSNAFHMHTTAINAKLRHIRNNTELKPIDINNKFDMNKQEFVLFPVQKEPTILPGDELIVECHYSTKGKLNTVKGGPDATNEMCHNWMIVYPKTDLIRCSSYQPNDLINKFYNNAKQKGYWDGKNYNISKPNATQYYTHFFNSINQPIRNANCIPTYYNKFQGRFNIVESQNGFTNYANKNEINYNGYIKTWIIVFVAINMGIFIVIIAIAYVYKIYKKKYIQTTDNKTTEEIIPFIYSVPT
eukprot:297648_1